LTQPGAGDDISALEAAQRLVVPASDVDFDDVLDQQR
jgi:hypothetical protein